jgi:LysM repeat protein
MKRIVVVSLLIVALLLPMGVQTASASSCPIHIVQRGENLYRISLRYGTSVQALAAANGIADPSRIYVGQRLVIPCGSAPPPSGGHVYTVRHGDTLYSIARHFGVSVQAIVQANGITNPNRIYVGQRLIIPGGSGTPPPSGGVWYTVRPGDTLAGIAWRFGVNMWAIVRANNLRNPNLIYAGQRLYIP